MLAWANIQYAKKKNLKNLTVVSLHVFLIVLIVFAK